ncbi:endo-1,4-beta-xylanase [Flagellimonas sp. 389]|uniref:endo-1,4-beta-xylanase n=1 Tax=Flagellimonas sp. 389 TaxID=2835862 RepID=UPI001BD46C86|nr:endo-1,4-beta-xylanase [Flagellimonas sp. 389]MBS9461064.1 endo-1,4-beta-xylanase [Flagellimonas sp. 389]
MTTKHILNVLTGLLLLTSLFSTRSRGVDKGLSQTLNIVTVAETKSLQEVTLKSAAQDFLVGVAVNPLRVKDSMYKKFYRQEFNSITAENAMKMKSILKGIDSNGNLIYDWTRSDIIVDFAESNNINVHGHALIWHESIPDFLQGFSGTNKEFELLIKTYVTDVVTRYKGKVGSWDVVNEAIGDNTSTLRNSLFLERMGEDYVKKCFQYARNADASVKLLYNDYNLVSDQKKQEGTFALIDHLKKNNLIDGVGYQMHINFDAPSKSEIQSATNQIVKRKLLVHFSELDVKVNPNGNINQFSKQRALAQRNKVQDVVSVYNDIPKAYKYALTIWGLKDNDSWIITRYGNKDWPLLFDDSFTKKEAYQGFIDALD